MQKSVHDTVLTTRTLYDACRNANKVLCKCQNCETAAQGKVLYERQPKMAIRTCFYHFSKERNDSGVQDGLQQQPETSGILVQQSQSLSTAYKR